MILFNVASNLADKFRIGYDEPDNFYLEGYIRNNVPVISCRICGPDGQLLCGLRDNNLTPDTPAKYRFQLTREGWPWVYDDSCKDILRITQEDDNRGNKIIYIRGEFFDKHGQLAAKGDDSGLVIRCPLRLG